MKYLRALIAGIFLPSLIVPFILIFATVYGKEQILHLKFYHLIPLLWGVWNILYVAMLEKIFPGSETVKYLISGALLGIIVAAIAVFWTDIPHVLGLSHQAYYFPFIIAPIVYALLWWLIVKPLNKIVGIK